jgi:rSAM/selenodomain-associated transferase 1
LFENIFETIPPPPKRLLVFARLPEHGAVKTRLASELGPDRALTIYSAMLRDALASIGESKEDTEVEVLWAPTEAADGDALAKAFGDRSLAMQTGETLGDRLSMAFSERFFFHRTERIIAVGVDDPTIPRPLIDAAFELLESCDWVVGPARDGGYYLIGCRGPAFESEAFQEIAWGTSSVFKSTIAKIRAWQRNLAILPMRSDIDTAEDLEASEWRAG